MGHCMRGTRYKVLPVIMQGKITGRTATWWLPNFREWYECSSNHFNRAAVNKVRLIVMIAKLRKEMHLEKSIMSFKQSATCIASVFFLYFSHQIGNVRLQFVLLLEVSYPLAITLDVIPDISSPSIMISSSSWFSFFFHLSLL